MEYGLPRLDSQLCTGAHIFQNFIFSFPFLLVCLLFVCLFVFASSCLFFSPNVCTFMVHRGQSRKLGLDQLWHRL